MLWQCANSQDIVVGGKNGRGADRQSVEMDFVLVPSAQHSRLLLMHPGRRQHRHTVELGVIHGVQELAGSAPSGDSDLRVGGSPTELSVVDQPLHHNKYHEGRTA